MLLKVEDMQISYNGTRAISGISMHVSSGSSIGIIGPNGSGKSTLLKGIAGVAPLNNGKLIFDGADITGLSPKERLNRSIVFLPQGIDVFASLTVEDNLKLFISETSNSLSILDEAYSFYKPLWEKRKKLAGNLSGGERRLLSLSRAFTLKPKLFLADEPTAGLAPAMIDVVVQKVEEVLNKGTTLILVEQILPVAKRLVDCFYVLSNGFLCTFFSKERLEEQKEMLMKVFMGVSLKGVKNERGINRGDKK